MTSGVETAQTGAAAAVAERPLAGTSKPRPGAHAPKKERNRKGRR